MEKKKISLFYIILPGFLLLLLAVFLFIRFAVLRPWLVRFETSQPPGLLLEEGDIVYRLHLAVVVPQEHHGGGAAVQIVGVYRLEFEHYVLNVHQACPKTSRLSPVAGSLTES